MASRADRDRFLYRMVLAAVDEPRVTALWLEGDSAAGAQSPAGPFDLHVALPDPEVEPFVHSHESFLKSAGPLRSHEAEPDGAGGLAARVSYGGNLQVHFTIERQSLLAKRLRRAVVPLVDKTGGQLRAVMSFAAGHEMGG